MPHGYHSTRAGVGIVFRLQEKSGKIVVHSLNRAGAAVDSGEVQEGDELLTVAGVAVTASTRPVGESVQMALGKVRGGVEGIGKAIKWSWIYACWQAPIFGLLQIESRRRKRTSERPSCAGAQACFQKSASLRRKRLRSTTAS